MYLIRTPNAVDAVSGAGPGLATEEGGASWALPAGPCQPLTKVARPASPPPSLLRFSRDRSVPAPLQQRASGSALLPGDPAIAPQLSAQPALPTCPSLFREPGERGPPATLQGEPRGETALSLIHI